MKKTSIAKVLLFAPYLIWIFLWVYLLVSWNEWGLFIRSGGKAALFLGAYLVLPVIVFFLVNYFFYKKQRYVSSILVSLLFVIVGYGLFVIINNTINPCAIANGCGDIPVMPLLGESK